MKKDKKIFFLFTYDHHFLKMFSSRKRLKRNVDPNSIPRFNFQEFVLNSTPDIFAALSEDQVSEGSLTTEEIFESCANPPELPCPSLPGSGLNGSPKA